MILESVATKPLDIEPVFLKKDDKMILMTTPLFEFLLEHIDEDKGELAATAQMYLARGLLKIAKKNSKTKPKGHDKPIVLSGGVAYNKMISGYMIKKGVLFNEEMPCGDGCMCYGQAYLANIDSR